MKKSPIDRRRFLRTAAGCSLVSAWALSACATVPTLRLTSQSGRVRLGRQEMQAAMADGDALLLQIDRWTESIYLARDAGGEMLAVGATCTHLSCQVRPAKGFFQCPCHGSTFTFDGDVVRGPATRPLSRYPLHVTNDHIEIELP